jgi:hypothetical protein
VHGALHKPAGFNRPEKGYRFLIRKMVLFRLMMVLLPAAGGVNVRAQEPAAFRVVSVEGSARVQRSQKRAWDKVEIGDKLFDNDLVETYFQTKLTMQFGVNNVVILGSNSKALLNIAEKTDGGKTITDINLTLFNGGVFSKAVSDCKVNIYTAHAVGTLDSGSVTTIAEGKTGETGFQVLGGSIYVRNIAQQKGIELRAGLTTMIQPNKEPSAPLYITYRHVAVLQHFFGEEYVTAELDASGIKPTDERAVQGGGYSGFAARPREYVDEGMYKSLFSLNKIYGSILDDREKNALFYDAIDYGAAPPDRQPFTLALQGGAGIAAGEVSPLICPSISYHKGKFDAGIRLSFVGTVSGFSGGFTSPGGIVDKIDHLAVGSDRDAWSIFVGPLRDVSFGSGLIVDHFSNLSHNNAYHPLGFSGKVRILDNLLLQAFTSSLTAPYVAGTYLRYTPQIYQVGIGYAADFNQYADLMGRHDRRYAALPSSGKLVPSPSKEVSSVHCYMADLSAAVIDRYDLRFQLRAEFAQKLFGGLDGFVLRMPFFQIDVEKTSFGGGCIAESGKLLSSQFDAMYMGNRYRIKTDVSTGAIDSVITPNNRLSRGRSTIGFSVFYKMNPLRGMDIDFGYKQDISGKRTVEEFTFDSVVLRDIPGDFSYRLKVAVNDSLVKLLTYAEILLQQSHGRLFPVEGLPFFGWTFDGSMRCMFVPFFFGIAIEVGGSFFYIDSGPARDNLIQGDDVGFEFSLGIKKGF